MQGGGADVAVLGRDGRVELVGSTARSAGGVAVGARMAGSGVQQRGRWLYDVRGGRVRAVAIATRKLDRAALRGAMRLARNAKASQAPRTFVANENPPVTGRALAATGAPQTDAALTLLCGLLSR